MTLTEYEAWLRDRGVRLIDKADSPFSKVLDRLVRIVTFGAQKRFMTQYATTIGRTVYLPSNWRTRTEASRHITLRHEAVHVAQFERYTLVGASLIYLLPFFPLGLAYGRARLEWEAYAETFRATAELCGEAAARDPALRERVVRQFTSGAYGWMWPFPGQVNAWIDDLLKDL